MSRYLITGGAGFVGSNLANYLINQNHEVVIIDDLSSGKKGNLNPKCEFIDGNITNIESLRSIFDDIDFCYHFAAIASVQKSIDNWLESHHVNLTGTINILSVAAEKNVPVIYASSAAVYGDQKTVPISEDNPINSKSPYGIDKYCCELQAKLFSDIKGLKSIGLRFFNIYGKGQDPKSPYSGVISIFADRIAKNLPIKIFGDGNQQRDFIYIDDVIEALILAEKFILSNDILVQEDIYNICTGSSSSINQIVNILFDALGNKVDIEYLPAREGDIFKSIGNPDMASKNISFKATTSIEAGLKNLCQK